ncbi:MAG: hypothetical protein EBE86_004770 [Hormoscilla sp. GUM202]|nr:hypothetical protein [Hormoscilla sp. GUM202]
MAYTHLCWDMDDEQILGPVRQHVNSYVGVILVAIALLMTPVELLFSNGQQLQVQVDKTDKIRRRAEFQALVYWLCKQRSGVNLAGHQREREEVLLIYGDREVEWESWSQQWCQGDRQQSENWGGIYRKFMGMSL